MQDTTTVRRKGKLVFADTSWRDAAARGLAKVLPLVVPKQGAASSSATVGGLMGVGLRSL